MLCTLAAVWTHTVIKDYKISAQQGPSATNATVAVQALQCSWWQPSSHFQSAIASEEKEWKKPSTYSTEVKGTPHDMRMQEGENVIQNEWPHAMWNCNTVAGCIKICPFPHGACRSVARPTSEKERSQMNSITVRKRGSLVTSCDGNA